MPIRIGYLNGIALTLFAGQLPKLFGFSGRGGELPGQLAGFWGGLRNGDTNAPALALRVAALVTILVLARFAPRFPGILVAVAGTMVAVPILNLASRGIELVGRLPRGLPELTLPPIDAATCPPWPAPPWRWR